MLSKKPAKQSPNLLERLFPWTQESGESFGQSHELQSPPLSTQNPKVDEKSQVRSMPANATLQENQASETVAAAACAKMHISPEKVNAANLNEMEKQLEFVHEILAEISQTYSPHSKNERELKTINQHEINAVHDKILGRDAWVTFVTAPYQLRINGSSHSINYKTTTGKLDGITVNEDDKSLTIHVIESIKVGQITLEIPRKILDSKTSMDEDVPFEVRVVYREFTHKAIFSELYRNNESRIIQVDMPHDPVAFVPHDLYIRITGTKTIPTGRF